MKGRINRVNEGIVSRDFAFTAIHFIHLSIFAYSVCIFLLSTAVLSQTDDQFGAIRFHGI